MAALQLRPSSIECKFFKAAMSMKLQNLREIEDHVLKSDCPHPPNLKDFIFDGYTAFGTTPLILACQYGKLDSVKYLIETWGVDLGALAKYYSQPFKSHSSLIKIEKAAPLFVAAFHGYGQIVRYLLEKGADVSVKTFNKNGDPELDGLTPLYGAVSDRQYHSQRFFHEKKNVRNSIVLSILEFGANLNTDSLRPFDGQPMWTMMMCGINTTTALVNHGLNLKQSDPSSGETILHYIHYSNKAASLAFVKLLIEKGADLTARDNQGFTPLLLAAKANWIVLDYLLDRDEYSRMEKIEAMELVGASILLNEPFSKNRDCLKGFQYWRQAHKLREMEKEVSGTSAEKILGRKIGKNMEWTTLAELDQLEQHPEDYQIQAIMVKLRIIFSRCEEAARLISCQYLCRYFPYSTSSDNEEKIIQILDVKWGIFDRIIICRFGMPSSNVTLWDVIMEHVRELVTFLSTLKKKSSLLFNFETIRTSLDLFLQALNPSPFTVTDGLAEQLTYGKIMRYFGAQFSENLFDLLEMIFCLDPEILNVRKRASLAQSLRQLGHYRLGKLILEACKNLIYFKSLAIIRVILDAGAFPNSHVDCNTGDASIHFAAKLSDRKLGDAACRLLVEFGANLHRVNKAGRTALDIWIELNETEDDLVEEDDKWRARPEWCRPVPTLLCLAARVIRVHKIFYIDGNTPATLHALIELPNLR